MDGLPVWLDAGDKIASIAGAAAGLLALLIAVRDRPRQGRPARVTVTRVLFAVVVVVSSLVLWHQNSAVVALSGGLAGLAAAVLLGTMVRHRANRRPSAVLVALAQAQLADEARHRYRFFEFRPPALLDVYVRQRVYRESLHGDQDAGTMRISEVLRTPGHVLVVGGAGAGKSAMVATSVADSAREVVAGRVRAGRHAVAVQAVDLVGRRLPDGIAVACSRDLGVGEDPQMFAKPPVPGGQWQVFIDGLDEIADPAARGVLLTKLRTWLRDPSMPCQFVITCRVLPPDDMSLLRACKVREYELRPFDRAGLETFARRWFVSRHTDDAAAARTHAGRFLARVAGSRLGPVARVPLLATIAAMVYEHSEGGQLPASRAGLYERFVAHLLQGGSAVTRAQEAMLGTLRGRGSGGRQAAAWLAADLPAILDDLLEVTGARAVADSQADLVGVACTRLAQRGSADLPALTPDGRRLVRDLLAATGLFVVRGDHVVFAHQSFAEYFAARHAVEAFDFEQWRRAVTNPTRRSLAAFAVAQRPDADALVAGLVAGQQPDPVAAGDLLADGVPVTATTRATILELLLQAVRTEAGNAADCLSVLRELSLDAEVLDRLRDLAADEDRNPWTRAIVADAVAEIEPLVGIGLLRAVAALPGETLAEVRHWAVGALYRHGADIGPTEWAIRHGDNRVGGTGALGQLARARLTQQANDLDQAEEDRITAAIQLAGDGDSAALYGLVTAPEVQPIHRVSVAAALADHGDLQPLTVLARSVGLADRCAAASELWRRDRQAARPPLYELTRDGAEVPVAYCAAAMLASTGDLRPLVEVAVGPTVPAGIAAAAAKALSVCAPGVSELEEIAASAPHIWVRCEAVVGLLRRGHRPAIAVANALLQQDRTWSRSSVLFGEGRLRMPQRAKLLALVAATGDAAANRRLRHPGFFAGTWRRMVYMTALMDIDPGAGRVMLERLALQQWRRRRTRLVAGEKLLERDRAAGDALLAGLARRGRPAVRISAASVLNVQLGKPQTLLDLVFDERFAVRHRLRALTSIRRTVDQTEPRESEERGLSVPPIQQLLSRHVDIQYPKLPPEAEQRLQQLALNSAVKPQLRIEAATASLPVGAAADVLDGIAAAPKCPFRHRAAAAGRLLRSSPDRGVTRLRALVCDTCIARPLRWMLVLGSDELDDFNEFAELRDARTAIDADDGVQVFVRILWLMFTKDPAQSRT